MSTDARAEALAALALFQVTDVTVGDTLQKIADITVDAIPGAAIAGMTMLGDDEQPTTAVYTDEESPEIDAAQYRSGRGPCLDAWRQNRAIRIDEISGRADQYPDFVAACEQHGVMSTLSLPMTAGDVALGAMNLYARELRGFDEGDEALGLELAVAAGTVLANVSAYWEACDLSQQLSEAMRSRAVIEQAKGMIMATTPDLTADEAFDVLRKASQRENVKLRVIAERIVERDAPPMTTER